MQSQPFDIEKIKALPEYSKHTNKRFFCDAIGANYQKYSSGKSWSNLVGILEQCAGHIVQNGREISFYKKIEVKPYEGNKRNSKFINHLEFFITQQLLSAIKQSDEDEAVTLIYRPRDIFFNCFLINQNFLSDNEKIDISLPRTEDLDHDSLYNQFYNADRNLLKQYIDKALKNMDKCDNITFSKKLILTKPSETIQPFYEQKHRFLTDDEDSRYHTIKLELYSKFHFRNGEPCNTMKDIFLSHQLTKYFEMLSSIIEDEFDGARIDEVYEIKTTQTRLHYAENRIQKEYKISKRGAEFNKLLCECLKQNKKLYLPKSIIVDEPDLPIRIYQKSNQLTKEQVSSLIEYMHKIPNDDVPWHTAELMSNKRALKVRKAPQHKQGSDAVIAIQPRYSQSPAGRRTDQTA